MARFIIDRITSLTELQSLEVEWRDLERQLPRLPFFTFDWISTWWQHLHAARMGIRDRICASAFRSADGRLEGIAPMMLTERPGFGPLRLRQRQFFGADPNITEIRGVVTSSDSYGEILNELVDNLRSSQATWDFVHLTGVPREFLRNINLSGFGSASWVRELPNYYLTLLPDWNNFKRQLSRNIKESLRKCYNAPKRDGLILELEIVSEPHKVRAAVDEFLRLHYARAIREDTVSHPNVFSTELSRAFLFDICERFARRDSLRIFQLKLRNEVVATRIGFACQDALYLYFSGYEPALAKYSVMTRVIAEAIQSAIREGFRTVNLSTGNDLSKLRWSPQETIYDEALLISRSRRSAIAYNAYQLAYRGLRKSLSTYPFSLTCR